MNRALVLTWLCVTGISLWPALLNGGQIWFFDTLSYLGSAETALDVLFDVSPVVFAESSPVVPIESPAMAEGTSNSTVLGGRSLYYGVFLTMMVRPGWHLTVPVVQAAIFSLCLVRFLFVFLPDRPRACFVIAAVIAAATPAPFFTAYMMPDFLIGLAVLAMLWLVLAPQAGLLESVLWSAVLSLALLSHTTHPVIIVGLWFCAMAVIALCRLTWLWRGHALVLACLCVCVLGNALFSFAVTRFSGEKPLTPPFLSARVIEDGPGMTLLENTCPPVSSASRGTSGVLDFDSRPPWEMCRYFDRLPQYSASILWSRDPGTGVFGIASKASRRALSEEQFSFFLTAAARYPSAQLQASASLFAEQLSRFGLMEFQYTESLRDRFQSLSPDFRAAVASSALYRGELPLVYANRMVQVTTLLAVLVLIAVQLRGTVSSRKIELPSHVLAAALLMVIAVLGNGLLTGVLSAPFDRYGARIVWLVVLAAGLLVAHCITLKSEPALKKECI